MNKGKSYKNGVGRIKGETGRGSHTTQGQLHEELSITDPNKSTINRKNHQLQAPTRKDVYTASPVRNQLPLKLSH